MRVRIPRPTADDLEQLAETLAREPARIPRSIRTATPEPFARRARRRHHTTGRKVAA